jgi:glycosyltransferase involved in cell wall biosynthesis
MKICMICADYFPFVTGAEVFSYYYSTWLARHGHTVDVVTGKWDKSLPEFEVKDGVRIHRVPVISHGNLRHLSFITSAIGITTRLAKSADVIHANLAFSAGFVGARAKKATGKPLIVTVQGGDLGDYKENTGKFGGIVKPLIRQAMENADLVHAISDHTASLARKLGARNIHKIGLGIDTGVFKTARTKRDPNLLISVSRLTPKNGVIYLLKAMTMLTQKFPKLKLLVIGTGEQRTEFESFVRTNGIETKVRFAGHIQHDKLAPYLNKAAIFVRPSIDEGLGIAFLESMACGTPVVGTTVGGIPEIVKDKKTGLLVPPANASATASAISELLTNKRIYRSIADNGLKQAKSFDWDKKNKEVFSLYKQLVKK